MGWKNINIERRMECTGLILQSAINAMPPHVHNLNFILLLDKFNPIDAVHNPRLGLAFLKTFMKCCSDRLKEAVMVTGTAGRVFYNITKSFAPKSLVDKIKVVKSRSAAGRYMIEKGIVGIDHRSSPLSFRSSSLSSPLSSSSSFRSSASPSPSPLSLMLPSSWDQEVDITILPTFLGGLVAHEEEITKSIPLMTAALRNCMMDHNTQHQSRYCE